MHQCTHCQAQLSERAQFCSRCGAPVPHDQDQSPADTNGGGQQTEETSLVQQEQSQAPIDPPEAPASDGEPAHSPGEQFPEAEQSSTDSSSPQTAETAEHEETSVLSSTTDSSSPQTAEHEETIVLSLATDSFSPQTAEHEETIVLSSATDSFSPQTAEHEETIVLSSATDSFSPQTAEHEETIVLSSATDEAEAPTVAALSAEQPAESAQTSEQKDLERPDQLAREQKAPVSIPAGKRFGPTGRRWLVGALLVLLVVATSTGIFALLRQQASSGASPCNGPTGCTHSPTGDSRASTTRLVFAGTISGPMTISAQVRCQATTMANLRTLMVTLSGTVGEQFYNFGFVITHYNGPGIYHASLTILLDVPGDATNNGWGNMASTDDATITIARGEQAGSITSTLSGFGTRAGTQVQVSGDWACG